MAEKYYSILTNRGKELEAQSSATGKPVIIKDFVVGDGNGQPVKPDPAQTKLVREVYRNAISALQVSPDQANQFIAQLVLAAGVGGFVVREVGLLTDAGDLYSVANCAAIEKPENGVSVNLQYRLAVSETANIELKVAIGDGLFLRQDANLSDVKDASLSRKSLGLMGAAVLDVGKVANTVAAGDDTRIVNALQKNNNLSDLADKALARSNLQLRTAATSDVTTSSSDTTNGRVLKVGDYGLGVSDGNTENLNSIFDIKCSRLYSAYGKDSSNPTEGMPNDSGNTKYAAIALNVYQNLYWVALFSSSQFYIGYIRTQEKNATWTRYYSPSYKPTPGDLGAVPDTRKINNKRLNSDLELNASDVGAVPDTRRVNNKQLNNDITLNANDVGAMSLDAIIHITQGGTGASTQSGARTNLAAAKSGANGDITSITGLTTALSVTQGGTGAKTATAARANLFAGGIPTALNSAQGWWKCADTGRIFQHGKVVISSGSQLTFPIAFPNACFAVILTDNDGYKDVGLLGATTTYAAFTSGNGGTVTVGYLAIGY